MRYWLMKSEPDTFSIDDLASRPKGREPWDGVRNYQARNTMRDEMRVGDQVLFYHSNAKPPGVAGLAKVASPAYPDASAFDSTSKYYDAKSDPSKPRWMLVEVAFVEKFSRLVPLPELRQHPGLQDMVLLKRSRLSVQAVSEQEFEIIVELGRTPAP